MTDRKKVVEILLAMATVLEENKEYLTDLDNVIGDGDHGINMARGFTEVEKQADALMEKDIGTILKTVGMTLVSKVGGSSGPLYGTAFMKAGMVIGAKNEIDMNDFSDQALTLAAMAPFCKSDVHITHIGHIRGQECDRLHAMSEELTKRGITCTEEPDAITIKPGIPSAGIVSTYEDHRVAMSFALLGLKVDGIVIDNPSCCR